MFLPPRMPALARQRRRTLTVSRRPSAGGVGVRNHALGEDQRAAPRPVLPPARQRAARVDRHVLAAVTSTPPVLLFWLTVTSVVADGFTKSIPASPCDVTVRVFRTVTPSSSNSVRPLAPALPAVLRIMLLMLVSWMPAGSSRQAPWHPYESVEIVKFVTLLRMSLEFSVGPIAVGEGRQIALHVGDVRDDVLANRQVGDDRPADDRAWVAGGDRRQRSGSAQCRPSRPARSRPWMTLVAATKCRSAALAAVGIRRRSSRKPKRRTSTRRSCSGTSAGAAAPRRCRPG